jgi:hypothetical protein
LITVSVTFSAIIGGCGVNLRMTESTQRPVLDVLNRLNAGVTLRDSALNAGSTGPGGECDRLTA